MKHLLTVECSTPQMHKLKKGKKVRVKHGKGVHVIVKPETYNLAMRAFKKGNGTDLQLDEEELERNLGLTPEEHQELSETHMTGGGIFGPKFDRWLESKGLRDVAYELGDKIKPYAKAGAVGAITAGAAGLGALGTFGSGGTLAPLAPYLIPASAGLSALAVDYIDNPDKYHDTVRKVRHGNSLERSEETAKANDMINQHLGTNYDYMNIAGLQNAGANEMTKKMNEASVRNRNRMRQSLSEGDNIKGSGLGTGVHHSRRKKLMEGGTIGLNGNHVNYVPQALISQPYTANFSMSNMLPPQYQHLNNGGLNSGGLGYTGSGLYAGGGIREDAEQAYDSIRRNAQDLYSNISPVVKNAFHTTDQLIHGRGVKEDIRTVAETVGKYSPSYQLYKKIKGKGVKEDLKLVGETLLKYDPNYNIYKKIKGKGMGKRKIKGKGNRPGEYMTYQDKVNARNDKGYGY
jgi:hypothetical protein